ncbi:terminase large subunit domain-containing protein [Gordonia sp. SL306]|uniref:terminase large subunit domain-containing protein n=1 Tax=Gordonia sp. SL306 TaxID=2995145 RepID=UPI00226DFA27|nr:terminase family protein [Gordonia sp. SL306]WAC54261.1 terminase family protein [Gordonia sp. SL306]
MTITSEDFRTGVRSPAGFAEHLVGQPLWGYQREMVTSPARIRVMCAGRQVGKSRTLAIEALYRAYVQPGALVLLVSAGEDASQTLLAECATLASESDILRGTVYDETKHQIVLAHGSRIISVPASQKRIRGKPVDLLIIDEAGFVDEEIWQAALPTVIARPGSRIILSSTPWGGVDHFFRVMWQMGMDKPDDYCTSFHWPSSLSPLIDDDFLARIQSHTASHKFAMEYLAEWGDQAGAYFSTDELDNARAEYELVDPMAPRGDYRVVGGLDWGMAHDANAVVYLAASGDVDLNAAKYGSEPVFWIPAIEQHFRMEYATFIDRLIEHAKHLNVQRFISETNGVGQMPTQVLSRKMRELPRSGNLMVNAVTTTAARKNAGFARLKVLLQDGRLVLPNHPDLLRQLHALSYEQTETGTYKISVPDNIGHDDLAMALMQAASVIATSTAVEAWPSRLGGSGDILTTERGTRIPQRPSTSPNEHIFWGGKGDKV